MVNPLTGSGVAIGYTESYRHGDYGEPIVALKSYVLSPYVDENRMQSIITHVLEAHRAVEAEMAGPIHRGKLTSTGWDSL